jgi:hypothetical protein
MLVSRTRFSGRITENTTNKKCMVKALKSGFIMHKLTGANYETHCCGTCNSKLLGLSLTNLVKRGRILSESNLACQDKNSPK